jgi:hypothetical protein
MVFPDLAADRKSWLVETGARYVWAEHSVQAARGRLYDNVKGAVPDPHRSVVQRIVRAIDRYTTAFDLRDSLSLFDPPGVSNSGHERNAVE